MLAETVRILRNYKDNLRLRARACEGKDILRFFFQCPYNCLIFIATVRQALLWRVGFVSEVLAYTVKTKEPLTVQLLTANTCCCRFLVKFVSLVLINNAACSPCLCPRV